EAAELRAWGEIGRRLTMADVGAGVNFFAAGVRDFAKVPSGVRPFVLQVCSRQMILSAGTAAQTFCDAPLLAEQVHDNDALRQISEIAGAIARRSAKHSAEFLQATPVVIEGLGGGRLRVAQKGGVTSESPDLGLTNGSPPERKKLHANEVVTQQPSP